MLQFQDAFEFLGFLSSVWHKIVACKRKPTVAGISQCIFDRLQLKRKQRSTWELAAGPAGAPQLLWVGPGSGYWATFPPPGSDDLGVMKMEAEKEFTTNHSWTVCSYDSHTRKLFNSIFRPHVCNSKITPFNDLLNWGPSFSSLFKRLLGSC